MELFILNVIRARWTILAFGSALYIKTQNDKKRLEKHIFGADGNGGEMLKIYTYLTDQEIASLRFQKRYNWHTTKMRKDQFKSTESYVPDEELRDLGIDFPKDQYIEFNQRPPHDFYL